MKHTAHMSLLLCTVALTACGNEPLDQLEDDGTYTETDGFAVTKPKSKPPGSTGGICGVNFDECQDGQQLFDRFRALPRTMVKFSRELKNMNASNNLRRVTLTFRVPRMVNDHTGSLDALTVVNEEANADGLGGDVKLTYKRNGATVGIFAYDHFGNAKQETVDVYKGGWETIMAVAADAPKRTNVVYQLWRESSPTKIPQPTILANLYCAGGDTIGSTKSKCFWCRATQAGLAAGPGIGTALVGGLLKLKAAVATALNVGGAIAGAAISSFWDCSSVCERQDCTEAYCNGRISYKEYESCCRMHGGYLTVRNPASSAGECAAEMDLI